GPVAIPTRLIVLFDSSVIIPLLVPRSRSARLLRQLHTSGHRAVIAPEILREVGDKLRGKGPLRRWLGVTDTDVEQFIADLPLLFDLTPGRRQAPGTVPADPRDEH